MSNYFILQLKREYGVMIDSDAFLGAFTMDSEGQRIKVGPWSLGPGHRPQQPSDLSSTLPTDYKLVDQEGIRVSMYKKWKKYYRHAAGHIPYAVCKANGASPLWMEDGSEEQEFEIGGIGGVDINDGESDIEEHLTRTQRLGGRPLNDKGNHSQGKIKTSYSGNGIYG